METSELSRHAEENQKTMENLLSQLQAASKDQFHLIDQYRKANSVLRKTIDKTDTKLPNETGAAKSSVNADIGKKLRNAESELSNANKTINDLQRENTKLRKLESELAENESKLKNANQTIVTLNKENQGMKRELDFRNNQLEEAARNVDLNRMKIETIDSKWQEQIKENTVLHEQLTSLQNTHAQHQDCVHRLQQERDTFKHQIDDWVAKKHNTVHVQMYAAVNKELCNKMMDELEGMLSMQFELSNSVIQVEKYSQPPPQSEVPLIVICINASRLGTDVNQALQNISRSQTVAVVVLHHKEIHALPRQPSDKLLIGSDYKHIGAIVDIAYLTTKGIYPCDMNEKSLDRLVDFIRSNSR